MNTKAKHEKNKSRTTSWGESAEWYHGLLNDSADTYQKKVILPNLLRLLEIKKNETILDLACGEGFFSREFAKSGGNVVGVDVAPELILIAKKISPANIDFKIAGADNLPFLKSGSVDKAVVVLALQNMENINGVLKECARILKSGGGLYLVLNHPAFRVPKASSWEWTEKEKMQYRRIDRYLSESKVKIQMHPGDKPEECTLSFHRPLQFYFKALNKNGFAVTRLEEWISHKKSQPGPRAAAEDRARKEIPMFLFLEARIIANDRELVRE